MSLEQISTCKFYQEPNFEYSLLTNRKRQAKAVSPTPSANLA
jgi:hypothetical protein